MAVCLHYHFITFFCVQFRSSVYGYSHFWVLLGWTFFKLFHYHVASCLYNISVGHFLLLQSSQLFVSGFVWLFASEQFPTLFILKFQLCERFEKKIATENFTLFHFLSASTFSLAFILYKIASLFMFSPNSLIPKITKLLFRAFSIKDFERILWFFRVPWIA